MDKPVEELLDLTVLDLSICLLYTSTASTTANESQTPTESVAGQTREAVTTDRAASETASVPNETNVTGGQYYSCLLYTSIILGQTEKW